MRLRGLIDLTPGTAYDVEVTLSDGGNSQVIVNSFTTRALPAACGGANKTITAGSCGDNPNGLNGLVAGDVIQFQNGTYNLTAYSRWIGAVRREARICIREGSPWWNGVVEAAADRIVYMLGLRHI